MGGYHGPASKIIENLDFQSIQAYFFGQNGGQGPDKHTTRNKNTFGGSPEGPQGAIMGRFHGPAIKIIENLDFQSIQAYFFSKEL